MLLILIFSSYGTTVHPVKKKQYKNHSVWSPTPPLLEDLQVKFAAAIKQDKPRTTRKKAAHIGFKVKQPEISLKIIGLNCRFSSKPT